MLLTPITNDERSAEVDYAKLFAVAMFITFEVMLIGILGAVPELALSGMAVATLLTAGFFRYQTKAVLPVH